MDKWFRLAIAFVAIAAIAQGVAHWDEVGADGLSYITIADLLLKGDYLGAVSGSWSPLYPTLTAIVWTILGGARGTASIALHVVTTIGALMTIAGTVLLSRQLSRATTSTWQHWFALAVAAWVVLEIAPVSLATPDPLLTALLVFATLTAVRAIESPSLWKTIALGVLLGLAYLTKTIAWYFAFVQLALFVAMRFERRRITRLLACVAFILVAVPFVSALSDKKDRLTVGDAGRHSVLWNSNGVPQTHFQGDSIHGFPKHASRIVLSDPTVYEYASPFDVTYPPSFDPSYWYDGVNPQWSIALLSRTAIKNAAAMLRQTYALLAALLIIIALAWRSSQIRSALRQPEMLIVLLPALTCLALYQLTHFEGRYLAPFLLLCSTVIAGIGARASVDPRIARTLTAAFALIVLAPNALRAGHDVLVAAGVIEWKEVPHMRGIAREVARAGLHPGDRIGAVGQMYRAYWAYLAELRIIAEVSTDEVDAFWKMSAERRNRAYEAMKRQGATAIVSWNMPDDVVETGWQRMTSGLFVRMLAP